MQRTRRSPSVSALIPLLLTGGAVAQCANTWQDVVATPRLQGFVTSSTLWDPDGPGPKGERIVVVGQFLFDAIAFSVAAWDPGNGAWSPVGPFPGGSGMPWVNCVVAMANGDLVVGGQFATLGGVPASNLARWNGTAWSALGTGTNGNVETMVVATDGSLVVGGTFTSAGGLSANRLARWDGSTWSGFGGGADNSVLAMVIAPNGDLVIGGDFSQVGGVPAARIARWNGVSWSALGPGSPGTVWDLAVAANGDIVAGGVFWAAGRNVMRWNGSVWSGMGPVLSSGPNGPVYEVEVAANGDIVVAGDFSTAGGIVAYDQARWDGTAWRAVSNTSNYGFHAFTAALTHQRALLALPNGAIVTGFNHAANTLEAPATASMAMGEDGVWSWLGSGLRARPGASIKKLGLDASGNLIAIGAMPVPEGWTVAARWNGSRWIPFALQAQAAEAQMLARAPNGDLVISSTLGMSFPTGGGGSFARWNGTTWSVTGGSGQYFPGSPTAFTILQNGEWIGFGTGLSQVYLAKWDGSMWAYLAIFANLNAVQALCERRNGDLLVGGNFSAFLGGAGTHLAKWRPGIGWGPVAPGSGPNGWVTAIAELADGRIVIGGQFTSVSGVAANRIAVWNGSTWSALGSGLASATTGPTSIVELPNGDLVVCGAFASAGGAAGTSGIARWNGTQWTSLAGGVVGTVNTAFWTGRQLVVGGEFGSLPGASTSLGFGWLGTSCPAATVAVGAGCPSSGGSNTLAATTPAWAGSTFRAQGTGLPTFAFVAAVTGLSTTALPLPAVFPAGQAGCNLLVAPDAVDLLVSNAGSVATQLALPNSAALAGVQFFQQLVPMQVDAALNFTAITATNALGATVGVF